MIKQELYPSGGALSDPLFLREAKRYEGLDPEDFLGKEKEPSFIVYLSAPLQATTRTSALQHIIEVVHVASLIEGACYEGQRVVTLIPHTAVLPLFNEFKFPILRGFAMEFNIVCLEQCHALIKIGGRISRGMQAEIIVAEERGLPIMSLPAFRRKLTNLPSAAEAQETFARIIKSLPPEMFAEGLFQRKSRR